MFLIDNDRSAYHSVLASSFKSITTDIVENFPSCHIFYPKTFFRQNQWATILTTQMEGVGVGVGGGGGGVVIQPKDIFTFGVNLICCNLLVLMLMQLAM